MWGNLNLGANVSDFGNLVGVAIQSATKIAGEIESQLDAAVADDEIVKSKNDDIARLSTDDKEFKLSVHSQMDAAYSARRSETATFLQVVKDEDVASQSQLETRSQPKMLDSIPSTVTLTGLDEIKEKDLKLRQGQSLVANEIEFKREISKLQEIINEKDLRLASFETEGQQLARKQGELEKIIKKNRAELKEKDGEISKLKESKENLIKTIEEMQDTMRRNEGEVSSVAKNLSVMHAVSQATTDKLSKLEAEISAKNDELATQRRALESAWAEAVETKRALAEIRAERDDLKRQMEDGLGRQSEIESVKREIEQREAVLRATNKQLQDSLQRQMLDSSQREERLREELQDLRKRWQDAVISRESLSTEITASTAPLLRQISSLQESLRVKAESWQHVESALTERMMKAESVASYSEHRRNQAEEHVNELKQQLQSATARLHDAQESLQSLQVSNDRYRRLEEDLIERMSDLECKFGHEQVQRQSLQVALRDQENKHRLEAQESRQAAQASVRQADLCVSQIKLELEKVTAELDSERKAKCSKAKSKAPKMELQYSSVVPTDHNTKGLYPKPHLLQKPGSLPSGELSFAASERLASELQQKEEDIHSLQLQIKQLQMARDALLQEVNYLSSRNMHLEEQLREGSSFSEKIDSLIKQNEVLLTLLGEKEEELEACYHDMKEMKNMYKSQMQDLLDKVIQSNGKDT